MKSVTIVRTDFTCSICNQEYLQSLRSGSICYYCHHTYGPCCKGKYGTCSSCWNKQTSTEKHAQKKRYWSVVRGNLKPTLIILPILFFSILGSVLMSTVGTFVGLPILLVGTFGSVGIFSIVYIKKARAIERKYDTAMNIKKSRPPMQKYEKIAIIMLFGLLGVIVIGGLVVVLIFFA